jgi:hypothetical protein
VKDASTLLAIHFRWCRNEQQPPGAMTLGKKSALSGRSGGGLTPWLRLLLLYFAF